MINMFVAETIEDSTTPVLEICRHRVDSDLIDIIDIVAGTVSYREKIFPSHCALFLL